MATVIRLTRQDGEPVLVNFDSVGYAVNNGDAGSQIVFTIGAPTGLDSEEPVDMLVTENLEQIGRELGLPDERARNWGAS
jgi:hypothetical protein